MRRPILLTIAIIGMLLVFFAVLFFLNVVGWYNNAVGLNEEADQQWGQVQNQYQRRADLIPNLVNTVKGYAEKEEKIFTQIADARSLIGLARSPVERLKAEDEMTGFLSRLLVIAENYPQLKASDNFRDLQAELAGTENRIAQERRRYNQVIQSYNFLVKKFPGRFYAVFFGFEPGEFFEAVSEAQTAPKVDFNEKKE
ncbi:MAG: LemA family protein [Candidatus Omnitrophota bacterium]